MKKKVNLNSRRCTPHSDEGGANVLFGLDELCKKHITSDTIMLELGSDKGISTSLFSYYAKIVHTIDRQPEPHVLKRYKNVIHHKGNFRRMLPKIELLYPNGVDLIYIDGEHDYENVCKDIEMTVPLIKESGIISGHDYREESWCEVIEAVRDVLKSEPEVFADTSWLVKISDLK